MSEGWRPRGRSWSRRNWWRAYGQVSATPVEVCEGYADEDSGAKWTVQTHEVVCGYEVRVARTAEVLGDSTFQVPAGPCPMFSSYREGDTQPMPYYPSVRGGAVVLFVRPFGMGS